MHIKYSPCNSNKDTVIIVKNTTTIVIDGKEYVFDSDGVQWPNVAKETDGAILEAHREDGELYLTAVRFYSGSCSEWDTGKTHYIEIVNNPGADADGQYHEVTE